MIKNNKKLIQYENSALAKIFLYSICSIIIFIVGSISFAYIANSWQIYGSVYTHYIPNIQVIPLYIQSLRALALSCLVLFFLTVILILFNIAKICNKKTKRQYIYSLGIFTWLLLPWTFFKAKNSFSFSILFKEWLETKNTVVISHLYFKNVLIRKNKAKMNMMFWKTFVAYLGFITLLIGIITIFAIPNWGKYVLATNQWIQNDNDPSNSPLFFIFSYFTNLSNFWLFIFFGILLIRPNSIFFNKNSKFGNAVAYIFIVALIYWVGLFPIDMKKFGGISNLIKNDSIGFTSTIFLHAINPFISILLFILVAFSMKEKPISYNKMMQTSLVYPILYAVYIYTLPFITQYSTYGEYTNINPGSLPYYGATISSQGSLMHITILAGFLLIFIFSTFFFWFLNNLSSKTKFWKNIKIEKYLI